MISVSHAKHWQIREICEIRVRPLSSSSMCKKLFMLFELFVFKKSRVQKIIIRVQKKLFVFKIQN